MRKPPSPDGFFFPVHRATVRFLLLSLQKGRTSFSQASRPDLVGHVSRTSYTSCVPYRLPCRNIGADIVSWLVPAFANRCSTRNGCSLALPFSVCVHAAGSVACADASTWLGRGTETGARKATLSCHVALIHLLAVFFFCFVMLRLVPKHELLLGI